MRLDAEAIFICFLNSGTVFLLRVDRASGILLQFIYCKDCVFYFSIYTLACPAVLVVLTAEQAQTSSHIKSSSLAQITEAKR